MKSAFVVLFVLGLLQGALGQAPPVVNHDEFSNRNLTATFGMGVSNSTDSGPGTKVSGTKVELGFSATVKLNGTTPAAPTQPWDSARILALHVTCADASPALDFSRMFDPAGEEPPGSSIEPVPLAPAPSAAAPSNEESPIPQTPTYLSIVTGSQSVRIASTEFADGSTIHFNVTCKVQFFRMVNNVQVEQETQEKTIVATLTACNRLLLLATNEEYATVYNDPMHTQPLYQDYLTTLGPYTSQPLYRNVAAAAMPLVRPFWETVHHTIFPEAGKEAKWGENAANTDTVWRTQNLDAEMSKYTAFFAFTHGENTNPVHFRASVGPNTVSDGQVYGTEVRTYGYTGRTIPDYQVAIFYACSLGGSTSLPNGFKIDQINQPWKGIAGFPQQCFYRLNRTNLNVPERTLDEHAQKLMDYLSQGFPLTIALNKVQAEPPLNDRLIPLTNGGATMPMSANGSYARLRYVYLEPSVYDQAYAVNHASVNTWYWFI